jgi:putative ABC transport system permease protein
MTLTQLAARNVLRNKFRAILTILGVAVAVLAFTLLRTLIGEWKAGAAYAAKDRIVTRNKVTLVEPLPKRYVAEVAATPHVSMVTFANWFGAQYPGHERDFFATFAVEPDTYFQVYGDVIVPPEQMDAWHHDKQGAIVGEQLAKRFNWHVGDKVTLVSGIFAREGDWEFHIDGIYTATSKAIDRNSFFFNWNYMADEYANKRRIDSVGWIVSKVDDPANAAGVALSLDKQFEQEEMQTESQDEHAFRASFLAMFSAIITAVNIVSLVILVIMLLILGNTIAMGVRERTNEYGVLKALGFSGRHIAGFIVFESALIALIGGLVGTFIAVPFVNYGMGRWLEENMTQYFPHFRVDAVVVVIAVSAATLKGIIAATIPAVRASRLRVVDALRRVA